VLAPDAQAGWRIAGRLLVPGRVTQLPDDILLLPALIAVFVKQKFLSS